MSDYTISLKKIEDEEKFIGKTINIPGLSYSNNYLIPIKVKSIVMCYNYGGFIINGNIFMPMWVFMGYTNGRINTIEIGNPDLPFRDFNKEDEIFGEDPQVRHSRLQEERIKLLEEIIKEVGKKVPKETDQGRIFWKKVKEVLDKK
jgi:hypothetical protein